MLIINQLPKIKLLNLSIMTLMFVWGVDTASGDSTKITPLSNPIPGSYYLLTSGVKQGVYAGVNATPSTQPVSWGVPYACLPGLIPYASVALATGFLQSSGSSEDKGIRGFHLKLSGVSTSNQNIYMTFSEAYVDIIGGNDKSIDVAYWIYCIPPTA